MDALRRLVHIANNTSPGEAFHIVANAFLNNIFKLYDINMNEAADLSFTSIATINRFVKHIGYSNFSDFKSTLLTEINFYAKSNRRMPLVKIKDNENYVTKYLNLMHSKLDEIEKSINMETIHAISEAIYKSKIVVFIAPEQYNFPSFQLDLAISGKESKYIPGKMEDYANADIFSPEIFTIFVIPNTRETIRTLTVIKHIKGTGAITCIIARSGMTLFDSYADYILNLESTDSAIDDYMVNVIMDLLIIDYRLHYVDPLCNFPISPKHDIDYKPAHE